MMALSKGESGLFADGVGSTRRRVAGGAFRRPQPSKEVLNELERMLQSSRDGFANAIPIFLILSLIARQQQ